MRPDNTLTQVQPGLAAWESKVELVKRMVAADASPDEFEIFLHQCRRTGLDPLARQIYCIVRGKGERRKATIQTGIDGFRLTADRSGVYAGSDKPEFGGSADTEYWQYDKNQGTFWHPETASVTVYKLVGGIRCAFTAEADWYEYYPGDQSGEMWRKMPKGQLAKCAEALALRKAFPADLSGIYTPEEMAQADSIPETYREEKPPQEPAPPTRPAAAPTQAARQNAPSAAGGRTEIPSSYGYQPREWPLASTWTVPMTVSQGAMLDRKAEERNIPVDDLRAFCKLVLVGYGREPEEELSKGSASILINWLMCAPEDAKNAVLAELNGSTIHPEPDVEEPSNAPRGGANDPRRRFEEACYAIGWPSFSQDEKGCRAVYRRILGRAITNDRECLKNDWQKLVDWQRRVSEDPSLEPMEFKTYRLAEGMK